MRRIIYIATFNLFFHFYAQPLFVFIVIIIFIISTSLILSLLQLLLSLVVNSSSNSTNRVISFLLSLLVIALLKYQYHLLYQLLFWVFYVSFCSKSIYPTMVGTTVEIKFQNFFVLSLPSHLTTITTISNFYEFIFYIRYKC